MYDDRRSTAARMAAWCWALALLCCALGVYFWVADPLYDGVMAGGGLGSLFSMLASFASVGAGLVLGAVGLVLTRRVLLLLGLINLAVLVTGAYCLYADGLYPESTTTHSGLALLAVSALISAAMFAMHRSGARWRRGDVTDEEIAKLQRAIDRLPGQD